MPYTNQELLDAINDGKIEKVRLIINDKDPTGIPFADLNEGTPNQPTALLYATDQSRSAAICKLILEARNNNQEPIINLNQTSNMGSTALSHILYSATYTPAEKIQLTNFIINMRNPNGSLAFNFDNDKFTKPLFIVVIDRSYNKDERYDLLNILLDTRKEDGSYAISLRENYRGKSYLEYALENTDGRTQTLLADAIAARSVISFNRLEAKPFIQAPVLKPNLALSKNNSSQKFVPTPSSELSKKIAEDFSNKRQNTHEPEVEKSVTTSLLALEKYYPNVDVEKNIREIKNFISSQSNNGMHLQAFYRITERFYQCKDSYSQIHFQKIWALLWEGAKDPSAPLEYKGKKPTESEIALRKHAFYDRLLESEKTYTNDDGSVRPSCVGGTRNLLTQSLHGAHPCVKIFYSNKQLGADITEKIKSYLVEKLEAKSTEVLQRQILSSWEKLSTPNGNSPAHLLFNQCKKHFEKDLLEFSNRDQENILEECSSIRPTINKTKKLDELILTIGRIYLPDTHECYLLTKSLKELAAQVYNEKNDAVSFEQSYTQLNEQYECYQKVRNPVNDLKNNIFPQIKKMECKPGDPLYDLSMRLKNDAAVIFSQMINVEKFLESYKNLVQDCNFLKEEFEYFRKVNNDKQNGFPEELKLNVHQKIVYDLIERPLKNSILEDKNSFKNKKECLEARSAIFAKKKDLAGNLLNIALTYKSSREQRQIAINKLHAIILEMRDETSEETLQKLYQLRNATQEDYAATSYKARFLPGRFFQKSKLVQLIDQAIQAELQVNLKRRIN